MPYLIWSIVAVVAAVGVVALIGALLPVAHEASRSAFLPAPPADVFAAIQDLDAAPSWRSDVTRIERLEAAGGLVRFREHSRHRAVVMEVVESQPPSRLVTRIADPGQPFGGSWTFAISPEPAGSRLTITERGEVYNPIFRFMARFVLGYTGTLERYLRDLQALLAARARTAPPGAVPPVTPPAAPGSD